MGINQEEIDRAFASAPPGVRQFKPGAMALPFRTADGKLTLIDLTRVFEPMTFLTGNPETSAANRILQNLASMPVNGGIIEPGLREILDRTGLIDPMYRPPTLPEWRKGTGGALLDTAGRVLPAVLRNTYNTLERGGAFAPKGTRGPDVEPQSAAVTGANLLLGPNRLQEIGGPAQEAKALRNKQYEVQRARQELRGIKHLNEGQSMGVFTGGLNKQEAVDKARGIAEEKKKKYNEFKGSLSGKKQ